MEVTINLIFPDGSEMTRTYPADRCHISSAALAVEHGHVRAIEVVGVSREAGA